MTLETQAVRVAAAAAALVEDAQASAGPRPAAPAGGVRSRRWWSPSEMVLDMVRGERRRHAARWGAGPLPPERWLMILAAEAGALAEAVPGPGPAAAGAGLDRVVHLLRAAASEAEVWIKAHTPPAGTL